MRVTSTNGRALKPRAVVCAILSTCLALGGCASPYVPSVGLATDHHPETTKPANLDQVVAHLRAVHGAYRAKAIELGDYERLSMNSLIVLAGAIIGVAGVGGHTNALRNAAVIGGTALTLGLVNSDQRRAVIYVAGMKALECANEAITPIILHSVTIDALKEGADELKAETQNVSRAMGKVAAAITQVRLNVSDADEATSRAQTAINNAATAIDEAADSRGAADDLRARHALAAEQLQVVVARIDASVLDAIRGTEVSLQLLPRIIGGLQNSIGVFQLGAPSASETGTGTKKALQDYHAFQGGEAIEKRKLEPRSDAAKEYLKQLLDATADLAAHTATLKAFSSRLDRIVTAVQARVDAKPDSSECQVTAPTLAVTPNNLTFVEKSVDAQTVEVRGGKGPYYPPKFIPSEPTGLKTAFVLNDAKVALLTVTADATAAKGDFKVVVLDATGDVLLLPVRVTAAAAPSADTVMYVKNLAPLKVGGVEVTFDDVAAAEGGVIKVTYVQPAGTTVEPADVEKALKDNVGLKNLLGKGTVVATRKP